MNEPPAVGALSGDSAIRRSRTVGDLIELSDGVQPDWLPEELAAILRHQLNAPLHVDLAALVPEVLRELQCGGVSDEQLNQRFGELLLSRTPSLDLLQAIRRLVKRIDGNDSGVGVPREIGWVIYLAAVLAARVRLNQKIGSADDPTLRGWTDWAMQQTWLDESLRPLLTEGRQLFSMTPTTAPRPQ
jgi:hypothetical protein